MAEDLKTGSFFRINKKINDDFTRKAKDSKVKNKPGQSKRDVIVEKLLEQYEKMGDKIFTTLKVKI